MLTVEVIYSISQDELFHKTLSLAAGATVTDALEASAVFKVYPEATQLPVGVFSKTVSKSTLLREGDRVEIYRPLVFDPKDKRRVRAKTHR